MRIPTLLIALLSYLVNATSLLSQTPDKSVKEVSPKPQMDPAVIRGLVEFEMKKFGYSEKEIPGLTDSLTAATITFNSSPSTLIVEISRFELLLNAGGSSVGPNDRSIQAVKGGWRCVLWPRIATKVFVDNGKTPPPYKRLVAASIKEHALYYRERGKGFLPVNEQELKAKVWSLNNAFENELRWNRRPPAEKEARSMSTDEQAALVADIVNGTNSAPDDRTVLASALSSTSGLQLTELLHLPDGFGFNFDFRAPAQKPSSKQ